MQRSKRVVQHMARGLPIVARWDLGAGSEHGGERSRRGHEKDWGRKEGREDREVKALDMRDRDSIRLPSMLYDSNVHVEQGQPTAPSSRSRFRCDSLITYQPP